MKQSGNCHREATGRRMPRVNLTKMMDLRTVVALQDVTDRQCRSVKGELPLVRIGLTCPEAVAAPEELAERRR
jgi:hypothetical protein